MNQYPPQYAPQQNPYAAPQAQMMPAPQYGGGVGGARIEGSSLVVANGAPFPAVCVKCGSPQVEWRNQKFAFTPFWAWYFLGWIGYFIFTKRAAFSIPICQPHHKAWKKWNLFVPLSFVPLFLFMFLGVGIASAMDDGGAVAGIMITVGILAFIVFLIVAIVMRAKAGVVARKIDSNFSWLVGINPQVMQMMASGQAPQSYGQPQQPMMQQGYPQQQPQGYPQQPGYPQNSPQGGGGYGYPQ